MKVITYEEWLRNPTPRMMWVWDVNEKDKVQRKVIYFHDNGLPYPIIALSDDETDTENFKYCAEIEKQRRMTNKELARWLREKPTRECKWAFDGCICSVHTYNEKAANDKVYKDIYIRDADGEDWREPLVEV